MPKRNPQDVAKIEEDVSATETKPEAEKENPTAQATIQALMEKVSLLADQNAELLKEKELLKEDKSVDEKKEPTPFSLDIIQVVREILGKGFSVSINPINSLNFQLVIIPPPHLREHASDTRVKVIPYLEAEPLAKEYSLRVKDFCTTWATRRGINYQQTDDVEL